MTSSFKNFIKYFFYCFLILVLPSCSSLVEVDRRPLSVETSPKIALFGGSHFAADFGDILARSLSTRAEVVRFAVDGNSTHLSLMAGEVPVEGFKYDIFFNEQREGELHSSSRLNIGRSFTRSFFERGPFEKVFIQLMDYQLLYSDSENQDSVREILGLAESVSEQCYFVSTGPPPQDLDMTGETATFDRKKHFVDQVLKPILNRSKCELIDSLELLAEESLVMGSGLSYSRATAQLWANQTLQALDLQTSQPVAGGSGFQGVPKIGFYGESHSAQTFGDEVSSVMKK